MPWPPCMICLLIRSGPRRRPTLPRSGARVPPTPVMLWHRRQPFVWNAKAPRFRASGPAPKTAGARAASKTERIASHRQAETARRTTFIRDRFYRIRGAIFPIRLYGALLNEGEQRLECSACYTWVALGDWFVSGVSPLEGNSALHRFPPSPYSVALAVFPVIQPGPCNDLPGKRVPIGSVPMGGSCSVGQFRAASIFEMPAGESQGRIRFFLTQIF